MASRLRGPLAPTSAEAWRLDEWTALLASPLGCFIAGCDNDEIDQRGPVFLRDGSIHKACTEHWGPIFRVLGEQASWERTDAYRADGGPRD